jgi:hypothetical protein
MQQRKWKKPGNGHKDDRTSATEKSRAVITRLDANLFTIVRAAAKARKQSLSYTIYAAVRKEFMPDAPA